MHDIGAGWLMTSLSESPTMVALIQTATTLPFFFLALPAGALADIIDRRKYLIVCQTWMLLMATIISVIVLAGYMNAWLLVALTFAMGIGSAMMMPAWASVTPEIVPRQDLQAAIALNSLGMNVARSLGPALAGVLVSMLGTGAVFVINALSFFGVIIVLITWQRPPTESRLRSERFWTALKTGLRYARYANELHVAALRAFTFFLFASAATALLPIIARATGGGPQVFGLMVGAVGLGAIVGAVLLSKARQSYSQHAIVTAATLVYALCLFGLSQLQSVPAILLTLFFSGLAWICVLSTLQVAAQLALPDWVRSRGLAVFMALSTSAMAIGSVTWGSVAQLTCVSTALLIASIVGALVGVVASRWRLADNEGADPNPTLAWPVPITQAHMPEDQGPVLVIIHYTVAADNQAEFLRLVKLLGRHRRRNGAYTWSIFQDTENTDSFIESFEDESWLEHLRQHERVSLAILDLQAKINSILSSDIRPTVTHFVAPN
jgi:MFS family permease